MTKFPHLHQRYKNSTRIKLCSGVYVYHDTVYVYHDTVNAICNAHLQIQKSTLIIFFRSHENLVSCKIFGPRNRVVVATQFSSATQIKLSVGPWAKILRFLSKLTCAYGIRCGLEFERCALN